MAILKYSVLVGLAATVLYIIPSYRGYLAIGPGGIPHNFLGYSLQAVGQPFAHRDTTSIASLQNAKWVAEYGPSLRTSFLYGELPARKGDRATVPGYVAPQRQTSQTVDAAQVSRLNDYLHSIGKGKLSIKSSQLESPEYRAVWVNEPSKYLAPTKGEIAHVHPEGSTHLVLSLADAEEAISKGWAELHKLSGRLGRLPASYIMVYAPRDEDEFKVWKKLVDAAADFNTAS